MTRRADLVILGSGSTALAAALTAQEVGRTVVMTENRPIGGTCVNRGCLPSKDLIEAARLVHDARHPRYAGLTPASIDIDFNALVEQKDALVHDYRGKKYESLVGDRIVVERGHVRFVDPHTVAVDGTRIRGERLLIATGSRPVLPAIAGLDEVLYLTSDLLTVDEPMALRQRPASLVIVGGGYVALELGQMFSRFGTHVTVLERHSQLLALGYEPEVGRSLGDILASEGLDVVLNATASAVRRDGDGIEVTASVEGQVRRFRAERLLVATGRRPNTDAIAIEQSGVQVNARGEVVVDPQLQTTVAHIFAAGDVIGHAARQPDGHTGR